MLFVIKKIVQPVLHISQTLWRDVEEGFIQGILLGLKKWLLSLQGIFKSSQMAICKIMFYLWC